MQTFTRFSRPSSRRLGAALAAGATGLAVVAAAPALAATSTPTPAVVRSGAPTSTATPLVAVARTVVLAPRGAADLDLPLRPAKGVGFTLAKARSVTMTVRLVRHTTATKTHPATTVTVVSATRTLRITAGSYTTRCTLTAPAPAAGRQSQFSLACGLHAGSTKVATLTALPVHFSLPGGGRQTLVWSLTVS